MLDVLENELIKKVDKVNDAKVLYIKIQGDYSRYYCEFNADER
jgi:hypothetical protein